MRTVIAIGFGCLGLVALLVPLDGLGFAAFSTIAFTLIAAHAAGPR